MSCFLGLRFAHSARNSLALLLVVMALMRLVCLAMVVILCTAIHSTLAEATHACFVPSQRGIPITNPAALEQIRAMLLLGNDPRASSICTGEQALSVVHEGKIQAHRIQGTTQRVRVKFVSSQQTNIPLVKQSEIPPPPPPMPSSSRAAVSPKRPVLAATVKPTIKPISSPFKVTTALPWSRHPDRHIFQQPVTKSPPLSRPSLQSNHAMPAVFHRTTPTQPHEQAQRVAAIGDSITLGECARRGYDYPSLLQQRLGDRFIVKNFGSNGRTLMINGECGPNIPGNCSYVASHEWKQMLEFQPHIITIMLGANDARDFNWNGVQRQGIETYEADYVDLVEMLQQLPHHPKIFLMSLTPLFAPYPSDLNIRVIESEISDGRTGIVVRVAQQTGAGFIDIRQAYLDARLDRRSTCDGVHPADDGNRVIADTMAPFLQALKH